ncbi:hypothetical protein B0A65_03515 [Flavobacterium frigidimaris]|uniref:Carboxypeptidase regulatory-like domain-containing protein n=2 Tax=Flavobacterium frigidimaris TaxID=262320 RepID=A0ABX4BU52_FLAFR|nr:hypothetical protein B0A65_03515 [Flavobacterium frigidimaris]
MVSMAGCRKDPVLIKSGIETRVFGKLTDYRDKPISNLKVKVGEFKVTSNSVFDISLDYEFIQDVDSTYTDDKGNYNFTFKTSGKGNFYSLYFGEYTKKNEPQVIWEPFLIDITDSSNDMKYIGKEFEFNTINLIELYPCQITFKTNNLSTFPLTPIHNLTYSFNLDQITANGTSVQTIYIQKYLKETVNLSRFKDGVIQRATYEFPASNFEGITYQTIIVEENDFKDVK